MDKAVFVKGQNRVKKEEIVAELVEKLNTSKGVVFADYQGLTHIQLESLKKELKKVDSTIVIAKNSLLKISLEKSANYSGFKDNEGLNLPTATLFIGGDMVEPLKQLQKTVKEFGLPKIKFGILEGNLADEAGVMKIASLPNRETLLTQLVGTLNSPIQGLVVTLNGTIQKFVMTLSAVAAAKPAVAADAPAPAVETASEPAAPIEVDQTSTETPTETTEPEASISEEVAPAQEQTKTPESSESELAVSSEKLEVASDATQPETTETVESEGGEN